MIVKLLTEHHLEFLSLTGGYTGLFESTLVKMLHCWNVAAHSTISLIIGTHGDQNIIILISNALANVTRRLIG